MAEYVRDTSATAFGVVQDSTGKGLTARHLRKILQNHWQTTGIIGTKMSGDQKAHVVGDGSHMYYWAYEGSAVCSRGDSDGYTEVYWPAMATANVPANTSGNPRIDAVWVYSNDLEAGNTDNHVMLGVTTGTPSASPQAPSVRAGATVIQYLLVPAGAGTSGNMGMAQPTGDLQYALPHGASMGRLWHLVNNEEHPEQSSRRVFWHPYLFVVERTVELRAYVSMSTLDRGAGDGVCAVDFLFDSQDHAVATRKIHYDSSYTTYEFTTVITDIQPGWHNYGLRLAKQSTGIDYQIITGYRTNPGDTWSNQYSGVTFVGIDMGASA